MIYRLDFTMYFAAQDDAQWIKDQADVRLDQAVSAINPGQLAEEEVKAEVAQVDDGWVVSGMIAFKDGDDFNAQAYCKDAFDTFKSLLPSALADTEERTTSLSYHDCKHEVGGPCKIIETI